MPYNTEGTNIKVSFHPYIENALTQLNKKYNYRTGKRQTVYPVKNIEDINAIANWILKHKSIGYVLAFTLGINIGARANELLSLKLKHVLWDDYSVRYIGNTEDTSDAIEIFQSKTKKYRIFFLNKACKDALEWYFSHPDFKASIDLDSYLFPSREGGHIEVGTLRKVIKEAAKACGLKQNIGTHTLRKTWGWWQYKYNCYSSSMDITMLQRAFRHSSPDITLRYLGITDEEDKALYHNMCINISVCMAKHLAVPLANSAYET